MLEEAPGMEDAPGTSNSPRGSRVADARSIDERWESESDFECLLSFSISAPSVPWSLGTPAVASRPVKGGRPILLTPILSKLFTRPPFMIVVSIIVRRRMITSRVRKVIVEGAILAARVVVMVVKTLIGNIVVLMHARKLSRGWWECSCEVGDSWYICSPS